MKKIFSFIKENKLIITYISLILLILFIGGLVFITSAYFPKTINFSPLLHSYLEGAINILLLVIFFKTAYLYFKTGDKRMAIISGASLIGGFLDVYNVITIKPFPYDALTYESIHKNPDLFYFFAGKLIVSSAFLITVFYSAKSSNVKLNFIKKIYSIYLGILLLIIFAYKFIFPLFLTSYSNTVYLIEKNLGFFDEIFYFLAVFIYLGIEKPKSKNQFLIFISGLFLLGVAEIFYTDPFLIPINGIISHSLRLIGFLMILLGLDALKENPEIVSFRQKMSGYLSLFLVISYIIFSSLFIASKGTDFPVYFPFLFYVFILVTTVFQYVTSDKFIQPVVNIITTVDKFKPDEKLEKMPVISNDEIGLLTDKLNKITDLYWDHLQRHKKNQETEAFLRKIVETIRSTLNLESVKHEIVTQVGLLLKADRVFFADYDPNTKKYYVSSEREYRSSDNIKSFAGYDFTATPGFVEFVREKHLQGKDIIFSDLEKYLDDNNLRGTGVEKFYRDFGFISSAAINIYYGDVFLGDLVITFEKQRDISGEEINLIKTIASQAGVAIYQSNLYEKIKQVAKRENILRKIIETTRSTLDINKLKEIIVNEMGRVFNADRCYFRAFDKKKKIFLPPDAEYLSSPDIKSLMDIEPDQEGLEYFIDIVRKSTKVTSPIVVDIDNFQGTSLERYMKKAGTVLDYAIPLWDRDEELTYLVLHYSNKELKLKKEDLELIETISKQLTTAIDQSKLYETIKKQGENENFLRRIINKILTSENLDSALSLICEEIGKLFNAERVKIRNYNPDDNSFSKVVTEYRKSEQIPSSMDEKLMYPKEMSEYFVNMFIKEKKYFMVNDFEKEEAPEQLREFSKRTSTKSVIVSPIFYKNQLIANVVIENITEPKEWNQEKMDLLIPVCQQIAIGINLFSLNEELKKALVNEKLLREIIIGTRQFDDHDGIYNYLLSHLIKLFNPNRCIHLHLDENDNLFVKNEVIKDTELQSLLGETILSADYTNEMLPERTTQLSYIKDVNQEISNPELREFLITNKIQAYLMYATVRGGTDKRNDEVLGYTLVCYPSIKALSTAEVDFFRLIIDAISIIYLEFKQRQETEEVKRTFIATLTHDLRSPILAEQKALEAILSKKIGCSSEYLEDIHKTNEELLKIVNNLLSVYHYESGKYVLNKAQAAIKELVEESVRALKYLAQDKESQIYSDIQENLPLINVDKDEINRVISNLIGNAIKHTRKGTEIRVSAIQKGNNIQVSIHDNGEGIPKEHINMIFQRYPTEKRKVGTGLGLYLSKQIIEAHNGKIWFETQEGAGTTFYFTLPI